MTRSTPRERLERAASIREWEAGLETRAKHIKAREKRRRPWTIRLSPKVLAKHNVRMSVDEDEILHLSVDLKRELGLSNSGKNYLVATTFVKGSPRVRALVPGRRDRVMLNVVRPLRDRGPDTPELLKEAIELVTPEQREIFALWLDEMDGYRRPLFDFLANLKGESPHD